MTTEIKYRGLNKLAGLRSFIEQELDDFQREIPIESAQVLLEQQPEQTPPCHASVLLVVPGPDIRVTGRDHTILAAWLKAETELKRWIKERKARQTTRLKSNLQPHGSSSRRRGTQAGNRA